MAIAERFAGAAVEPPRATPSSITTPTRSSPTATSSRAWPGGGSLAGHLGLGKLICLWDDNRITLDGPASLSMSEDVGARYAAMGWQVLRVDDGDRDVDAIDRAIAAAKADTARPSLICVRTTIGYGSPKKAGTSSAHGSPLGKDEVAATKRALGWDPEASFHVPDEVRAHFAAIGGARRGGAGRLGTAVRGVARGVPRAGGELRSSRSAASCRPAGPTACRPGRPATRSRPAWRRASAWSTSRRKHPVAPRRRRRSRRLDQDHRPRRRLVGRRRRAQPALRHPRARDGRDRQRLAYHGGVRGFAATFFVFSDYMRPAVRLAALNHLPAIYVWTHDSIGVGEDGPTHQPVEHLMALRAMPNLWVIRPCDANETARGLAGGDGAHRRTGRAGAVAPGPAGGVAVDAPVERGGYVLRDSDGGAAGDPDRHRVRGRAGAGGLRAADRRRGSRARVVSLPCWEQFVAQDAALPRRCWCCRLK
jgi:transketolase